MNAILLTLLYDGSNYHGWIHQTNAIAIQDVLNQAVKRVIKNNDFKTIAASKTDAGVHAVDQKVLLVISFKPILDKFIKALNKALPSDIQILNAKFVDTSFNLREVKQKTYSYFINDQQFDIFTQRFEYFWKHQPIDVNKLQQIFDLFVGTHEFKLFSGLKQEELKNINSFRKIDSIRVFRNKNNRVQIEFKAAGFIRYQIRMIVGNCLACYLNKKITPETLKLMLQGKGNKTALIAKAKGLVLQKIEFN
ncbi:tRNA pseudouridine synthase A [Mycoplasma putrefaciens]|uniref:tRNA pseudouridine synthase A n=1 Tax=Mycoplasma putrefaciens Mput9231 TaxID=1292033 RepID=M9WHZ2_9MOLU|nr:tRNA pseudouridine synthase A [Mycoplasma putrefaciens]AGJ90969.1 tRNA pseudouridine synthase A [Mycoplasma putrefaciens Mput9231]